MQQIMAFPLDITVGLREWMCFCLKFCFLSGLSWSEYHCMCTELLVFSYVCNWIYMYNHVLYSQKYSPGEYLCLFLAPAIMANFCPAIFCPV